MTGWKTDAEPRRDYRICDGGIPGFRPFPRLWEVEVDASSYYNIETSVTRGSYVPSNEANCEVARISVDDLFAVEGEIRLGGDVTLNELFDGVEIVDSTTSGERKLTLTAGWAP